MPNVPASRGYTGGFGVDLMKKDVGLAVAAAARANANLPMGTALVLPFYTQVLLRRLVSSTLFAFECAWIWAERLLQHI
jgi:hypothetical protein